MSCLADRLFKVSWLYSYTKNALLIELKDTCDQMNLICHPLKIRRRQLFVQKCYFYLLKRVSVHFFLAKINGKKSIGKMIALKRLPFKVFSHGFYIREEEVIWQVSNKRSVFVVFCNDCIENENRKPNTENTLTQHWKHTQNVQRTI